MLRSLLLTLLVLACGAAGDDTTPDSPEGSSSAAAPVPEPAVNTVDNQDSSKAGAVQQDSTETATGMTLAGILIIILTALIFVHALAGYFWLWRKCCPLPSDKPIASESDSNLRFKARWLLLFLTASSLAFTLTTVSSCQFFTIQPFDPDVDERGVGIFRFGYFTYNNNESSECRTYPEEVRDDIFTPGITVARYVSVAACILVGIAFLLELFLQARLLKDCTCTWNFARCTTYLGLYCAGFTFFMLGWDFCTDHNMEEFHECKLGSGGVVAIVNVIVLIPSVVVGFFVVIPDASPSSPPLQETAPAV